MNRSIITCARLNVQQLENRYTPSAPVSLHGGVVSIHGTAGADRCVVGEHAGQVTVNFNGHVYSFKASAVQQIHFDGGAGNDSFRNGTSIRCVALGGAGDDNLSGGSGNDVLDGGAGDDILNGGAGDDRCNGGAGADHISGGKGHNQDAGGGGNDVVDGHNTETENPGGSETGSQSGSGSESQSGGQHSGT